MVSAPWLAVTSIEFFKLEGIIERNIQDLFLFCIATETECFVKLKTTAYAPKAFVGGALQNA